MSSTTPSPRENALVPTLFLIGVTALLVYFAIPRPYRDSALETPTPTAAPTLVAVAVAAQPTPEDHLMLMSLGLEEVSSSSVSAGSRLYSTTCTACHGSDAKGIPGLGKTLVDSPFVDKLNDDQLVAFLHVGRAPTDPENTTKVAMPAKGGNPSLTDEDLNAIVDYIRSLNGAKVIQDTTVEVTAVPTLKPFEAIDLNVFGAAPTSAPVEGIAASATPQAPATEIVVDAATPTPVVSYTFETQGQATAEPTTAPAADALPVIDPLMELIPTSVYSYPTGPDATNVPVTYEYEAQN